MNWPRRLVLLVRQSVLIEKGKYTPSLDMAFRIAIAFDVPIGDVFWYEELEEVKNKIVVSQIG